VNISGGGVQTQRGLSRLDRVRGERLDLRLRSGFLDYLENQCKLGNLSSGCDDLRAIYGVQFILPGQDFSAGLTGQGRVEGIIFGFSDPDLG